MRGFGDSRNGQPSEKWLCINQVIRDSKIAILAVQETHLTNDRINDLNKLFAATLLIHGSCDPTNPTGARGVAFALNKRLINTDDVTICEEEAGRALTLTMKWTNGSTLKVLNVYAPNEMSENANFWNRRRLEQERARTRKPDIVLGDFNMVIDPNDRLPPRRDAQEAQDALMGFLRVADVLDGWRARNPTDRQYTYLQQATGSQSRIDRIYIRPTLMNKAGDWGLHGPGFRTDHRLVTVGISNAGTPHQGKGRWAFPHMLLSDKPFLKTMKDLGLSLQTSLDDLGGRTHLENPQVVFAEFKKGLQEAARARARCCVPRLDRQIEALKNDISNLSNNEELTLESRVHSLGVLQNRLTALEVRRFGSKRNAVATNDWARGETICRYWTKLNAAPNPSAIIHELGELAPDGSKQYTQRSDEMARIAMAHYNGLQADPTLDRNEQRAAAEDILAVLEGRLSERQTDAMEGEITVEEVSTAIRESARGKAPGLDGLPTELWKTFLEVYERDMKHGRPAFNVARALQRVYNDIERHGLLQGSRFAEGWICPIYKLKKDQRDIVNYRPITLLNTDYKIMTRVLAMRIAAVAGTLIHRDQAGFVPGRQIFTHIKLSQMMIAYAEAEEVNGMIVALDQEKAYDRIDHAYLWDALKAYGFPEAFIRTVQSLYAGAISIVMLNGERSAEFSIVRGVRQGDPMSCLLFNVAIEPLATMLRKSPLLGFRIPGVAERILVALFADDTMAYLHEQDDYAVLTDVLKRWCAASRAKFNEDKTEHIPIGTKQHRRETAERTSNARVCRTLPPGARIVEDGVAVRSLGAWIGNEVDNHTPWEAIIATVQKRFEQWDRRHPTMYGRKLAAGMEAGGRTQFLARAQGMPDSVLERLTAEVARFVWKGEKKPRIARDMLYRPLEHGGIGLLDLKARNEAIELTWVRDYLDLTETRPPWAHVADILLARAVVATDRAVDVKSRVNTFLQTWTVSMHAAAKLPENLRRMMKAAVKYRVRVDAPNPSEVLKGCMPVWYHMGRTEGRSVANTIASKCLRDKHGVRTVLEAARVAERTYNATHRLSPSCGCEACGTDRAETECENPSRCALAARKLVDNLQPLWKLDRARREDGLSLTRNRKNRNLELRMNDGRVIFNPTVSSAGSLAAILRLFVPTTGRMSPARRPPRPFSIPQTDVEVFTDGSCQENGSGNARAGAGLWFGNDDPRNRALRVPGTKPSNQTGEMFAVAAATDVVPPFVPLHLVTDSRYVSDGLTVHAENWEKKGWYGVANAEVIQDVLARLRRRSAVTTIRWVKGHSGIPGNEGADKLAEAGAAMQEQASLTPMPHEYLRQGAELASLTQRLAYKGVRDLDPKAGVARDATELMINQILASIEHTYGVQYRPKDLWYAIRQKDVPRSARDFWWKAFHNALRVGSFWEHIPGYEQRAVCSVCGGTESLEHILLECTAPGQETVWKLVRETLQRKRIPVPTWSLGAVLGSIAVPFTRKGENPLSGPGRRLFRILLTESVHLIWRLRCHRVIECENNPEIWPTNLHVVNKWRAVMNRRLRLDCALAALRYGKRGLDRKLVIGTWRGILADEDRLPEDWTKRAGVLVGIPLAGSVQGVG